MLVDPSLQKPEGSKTCLVAEFATPIPQTLPGYFEYDACAKFDVCQAKLSVEEPFHDFKHFSRSRKRVERVDAVFYSA